MRKLWIVSSTVLLMGITLFAVQASKRQNNHYRPIGYTIVQTETVTRPGGEPTLVGVWSRVVKSNGQWKSTIQRLDQADVQQTFGGPDGVYTLQKGKKEFLSSWQPSSVDDPWQSTNYLRSSPQFVREETILGYKVFVLRDESRGDGQYTERYFAPQLGTPWIKMVEFRKDEGYMVVEPVSIKPGEPADQMLKAPDVPASFDSIKEKITLLEKSGRVEMAEGFRKQLDSAMKRE